MDVSIVIPSFNSKKLIKANLPKVIEAYQNPKNKIKEVIIVDDGSSDKTAEYVKKNFPLVRLIKHKKNRGFSWAVNTGVNNAKGYLVALLNTDVIPSDDFLVSVIPHFRDEKVFAVSLHEQGYGFAKGVFEHGFIGHRPGKASKSVKNTFWVSGGSGVFCRDLWLKLGGMDEKLFSPFYWEDVDLSYRALKRGYKLLWDPDSDVLHEHESTIGKIPARYRRRIQERNHLIFIWKNLTSPNLFKKHTRGLVKRIIKNPGYLIIFFMALIKIKEVVKARKREKKESLVSDEAVFASFKKR